MNFVVLGILPFIGFSTMIYLYIISGEDGEIE